MNLSDRQRKLLFAGLVVLLAAVGVYLTLPSSDHTEASPRTTNPATPAPASPSAPGIDSNVDPNTFDIYRLLPFPRRDFAAAADLAQRFTAAYGTYRYDEDPQAYMARLTNLVTDQLRTQLARDTSAPGLLDERRQQQVVAQGTASLDNIRDIEANSIIFEVTGKQQITRSGATTEEDKKYAVTVSRAGASWRVYAFEPADTGQAGDTG